jgi:hypothetical protein
LDVNLGSGGEEEEEEEGEEEEEEEEEGVITPEGRRPGRQRNTREVVDRPVLACN